MYERTSESVFRCWSSLFRGSIFTSENYLKTSTILSYNDIVFPAEAEYS